MATDHELTIGWACYIVCPWCDEEKCVGRFNCPQIKAYMEAREKEKNNAEN